MAKFGEVIRRVPKTLVVFYSNEGDDSAKCHGKAKDLRAGINENEMQIVKINKEKNQELAEKLFISVFPCYLYYEEGELQEKVAGNVPLEDLHEIVQDIETF